ncbi:MAG: lipoate--protein ligase family protein, partial [Spirochaetota bacterium]
MPVLRLATTDPFLNLAIEEHVLERIHDLGPTLILWRNDPCVVIGRHQNPWLECDLAALRRHGLPLVRRISGGGAVYHDGGNTNFSFLASESDYDQERHFRVVISGLSRLGIAAWKTDRNDLRVGDRKISGNAFRHTRGRSLHHGTLLVNADLDRLTAFLTPSAALIETKAIPSVRSRVVNLSDARPGLTHEPLGDAIAQAYAAEYGEDAARPIVADPGSWDTIRSRRAELASWEWVFGHTPTFVRKVVVEGADVALTVKRGAIVSV